MSMTGHLPAIVEISPEDRAGFGPAMLALTERQQRFVLACLMTGRDNNAEHARMAGYIGTPATIAVTGFRVAHDPKVLAAMLEEATKRMHSGVLLATSRLMHLAANAKEEKDQLKAISMILNRAGLHEKTEHKLTVKHETNEAEMLKQIERMAEFLGVDPKKLTGNVAILDGEFKVIEPKQVEAPQFLATEDGEFNGPEGEIDWNEPVEGEA